VTTREKKRIHITRWLVLLLLIAVGVVGVLVKPARPEVSLRARL